jgi:hypothetical protein
VAQIEDIRIAVDFWDHPKTQRLARELGPLAPIHLQRLWMFAANNNRDGNLSNRDAIDIAVAAGWDGDPEQFVRTLIDRRWIDETPEGLCLHNWEKRQPWVAGAEERSERAQKAIQARWDRNRAGRGNTRPAVVERPENTGGIRAVYGENHSSNTPLPSSPILSFPDPPLPPPAGGNARGNGQARRDRTPPSEDARDCVRGFYAQPGRLEEIPALPVSSKEARAAEPLLSELRALGYRDPPEGLGWDFREHVEHVTEAGALERSSCALALQRLSAGFLAQKRREIETRAEVGA